jgi:methyl-accepting chemotaxis protein
VRKLAEESQHAAQSIAGLIGEMQLQTTRAVEVVLEGARRTERGTGTVDQARDAFLAIGEEVEGMTGRVAEIAEAARRIAEETTGVESDVAEIAAVAEQQLASTAAELERLVAAFRVDAELVGA